jgi:hypothetical protein
MDLMSASRAYPRSIIRQFVLFLNVLAKNFSLWYLIDVSGVFVMLES